MSVTVDLPPELEERLAEEAQRRGIELGECVRRLIEERLPLCTEVQGKSVSAFGKYAYLSTSSEAFALRKQAEIDLEDRPR